VCVCVCVCARACVCMCVCYFVFRLPLAKAMKHNVHKCVQVRTVCAFSTDTFQFSLLYSYPCFPFYLFCVSLAGIWIFITCGGRIQDEIYDVLLTNPSREVAWRRIVYLRMHTRSIGRQNKNKIYFAKA